MTVVQVMELGFWTYVALGTGFGFAFVGRGAGVLDPGAATAPLSVRIVWWPGALALWPWLAVAWWRARRSA
ncbi:MAG: hypothetical protein IT459_09785 [Planctomycetes bacterium]|nr:hypothetical protein [Planctomycetota bacterium]